jgi:cellulose synthase operon protein B
MKFKFIAFALLLLWQATSLESVFAKQITVPLYELYPVEAIDLKCVESRYDIQLPIPKRWKINSAKLEFGYTNSASLVRKNSQLVVRLNGTPLAQLKLDPNAPEGYAEVDLPGLLLESGYNGLSFSVSQHYANQCEMPCAPELWTRLKLDQAKVTIDYDLQDVPNELAAVTNFLFDGKSFNDNNVHMITGDKSSELLSLAGVIASGVALRYEYQAIEFSTSDDIKLNTDNVLVGTKDFVTEFLGARDIDINIDAPTIQLVHLPYQETLETGETVWRQDAKRALLVISAPDLAQLKVAVDSFNMMSLPFTDSNSMKIYEFNLPEVGLYSGKDMIVPEQKYPLSKLNYETQTFRGFTTGQEVINFRVPPDFMIKPNQYVTVALNFAYGSGYRVDSVLNIKLNGDYVASVHLDNPQGGLISNYELSLPTYLFSAGINSIAFEPVLTPLVTENCSFIHAENLFLTLFDSSTITFPKMPHRVEMPRLDLMFVNGFPFTRWPDGHQTLIYMPQIDNHTVSAAFNNIGMLTQKNGYPLLSIQMTDQLPQNYDGELLVIGALDAIPQQLLDQAPLKSGEFFTVPYPVFKSIETKQSFAYLTQDSQLGSNKGIMMQFESPWQAGRSVVLLTAKTNQAVEQLSLAIMMPSVQANIEGDLNLIDFVFDDTKSPAKWRYAVSSVNTGKSYVTGKGGVATAVDSYVSTHPLAFWIISVAVILLVSLLIFLLLKRYRAKRIRS